MLLFSRDVILIPAIRWLRGCLWIGKHGFDSESGQTNIGIHSFDVLRKIGNDVLNNLQLKLKQADKFPSCAVGKGVSRDSSICNVVDR